MLSLRPICKEDCRLLWEWANDPDSRATAFNSEPIAWETHTVWFDKKLNDANAILYIMLDARKRPVAQVRFGMRKNGTAEVDVGVDPARKNRGFGTTALMMACQRLFDETDVRRIEAYIKLDNQISIRAFEKAGFALVRTERIEGCDAVKMIRQRDR